MLVFIPAVLNGLYRCMARGYVLRYVHRGHDQACSMFLSPLCLSPLTIASRKSCVFVCVAGGVLTPLSTLRLDSPRRLLLWNTDFASCGFDNEGNCTSTTTHSLRFTTNGMFWYHIFMDVDRCNPSGPLRGILSRLCMMCQRIVQSGGDRRVLF